MTLEIYRLFNQAITESSGVVCPPCIDCTDEQIVHCEHTGHECRNFKDYIDPWRRSRHNAARERYRRNYFVPSNRFYKKG